MIIELFAYIYCGFIVGTIGFQIALIAGAPWGRLTQGGRHGGALPVSGRVAAGISIVILLGFGLAILSASGGWPNWPRWTGWLTVSLQALVALANCATRSKAERRLWAPITTLKLLLAGAVMLLG
ncbi:MAG: hypothetical protein AAGB11_18110 [Pseudomonadota bacterium]